MDIQMGGWGMEGWIYRCVDGGWRDGYTDGWMGGWIYRWVDRWMEGGTDVHINI